MIPAAILVLSASLGLLALIEPRLMMWLCSRGIAHAEAVRRYREARRASVLRWDEALEVNK